MSDSARPPAREALEDLLATYAESIDERRIEALARVFTSDCDVRFGDVSLEGREALLAHLRESLTHFDETKHAIGGIVPDARASVSDAPAFRADVIAWHAFAGDRPTLTLHGYYDDTLAWTEEGWRITIHHGGERSRERGRPRPVD